MLISILHFSKFEKSLFREFLSFFILFYETYYNSLAICPKLTLIYVPYHFGVLYIMLNFVNYKISIIILSPTKTADIPHIC